MTCRYSSKEAAQDSEEEPQLLRLWFIYKYISMYVDNSHNG